MRGTIGYTRVSTDMQRQDGISLAMQRQKIAGYCMLKDLVLSEVIVDEGLSAKNLKRPGLQRLLAMVDRGEVEGVVVYKLDRLSRRTRDILDLVERFETAGVSLHSLHESLDTQSAVGRFVLRTLASLAEMELDLIRERTKDAMQHLKAEGKVYSRPRYLDEARIAWMMAERHAGRSYAEIAKLLNVQGVPTARGGRWYHSTVRQLLGRAA
jgi:site-specific DNA recombinase